jgi:phenylalanyl-tRNA synthetase beta subunit
MYGFWSSSGSPCRIDAHSDKCLCNEDQFMNISFDWLKNLIDIDLTAEQTAAELTRVGLAVEGIHEQRDDFVLDIDLTSNRPDCLSHIGVAR